MKILVIDDDSDIAALMLLNLKKKGVDGESVNNGDEAIKWLKNNSADMILLDMLLPDKNGPEILQEIRTFSSTPVIILTAKDISNSETAELLEKGAQAIRSKPPKFDELIQLMNEYK
ncbi:MAG: response regulator [Rhabdochlamydiaceae bacterium]|nr:response regulator [Candidatus Amphrikana amoebophyrae]